MLIRSEITSRLRKRLLLGYWVEARAFHEGAHLLGDFLEDLLGEVSSSDSRVVLDELNDVARDWLSR